MENWKDVPGYEGLYQVSNLGRVRSLPHICRGKRIPGKLRKVHLEQATGYLSVGLSKNGIRKTITVHRLVALAFVPNPTGEATVNHKNEIKTDNRAENLEWMSLADNLRYGTHVQRATANKPDMRGEKNPRFGKYGKDAISHKGRVVGTSKRDPDVVVEFETAADAARILKVSSGQLCDAINGKAKSCGGYYWRRVDG